MSEQQHNPFSIIKTAGAQATQEAAKNIFTSTLFDWVDEAQFSHLKDSDDDGYDVELREAIGSLWVGYASYMRKMKDLEGTREVYDAAVNCPVAGDMVRIWLDYARFSEESGDNPSVTESIYTRALVDNYENSNKHEQAVKAATTDELNEFWGEFYRFMKQHRILTDNSSNMLTVDAFRARYESGDGAVEVSAGIIGDDSRKRKMDVDDTSVPNVEGSVSTNNADVNDIMPEIKRLLPNDNGNTSDTIATVSKDISGSTSTSSKPIISESDVKELKQKIANAAKIILSSVENLPPEITAEWYARDGSLSSNEQDYQQSCPTLFSSQPSSIGANSSGKDLVGSHLALQLTRFLMKSPDEDCIIANCSNDDVDRGDLILGIVKACWSMTCLHETRVADLLEKFEKKVREEYKKLKESHDYRLSTAETGITYESVETMNKTEMDNFLKQTKEQHQNIAVWEGRKLLHKQQTIFATLLTPGFAGGSSVDETAVTLQQKICTILYSASLSREKAGSKAHLALLKSNEKKLLLEIDKEEKSKQSTLQYQDRVISPVSFPFPQQQHQQHQYLTQQQVPIHHPQVYGQQQNIQYMPVIFQPPLGAPPPSSGATSIYPLQNTASSTVYHHPHPPGPVSRRS